MTSTSSSCGDELSVTICPYGHIKWLGPRAKLEAIGLIPPNFRWPKRIDWAEWHADGFRFLLRRCRPDGFMGPMRRWMNYDYWFMRRSVPRHVEDMWRIHEPYRDLGEILFQATRAGEGLSIKFSKVHGDERIERFEARLVAKPVRRKG